MSSRSLAWVTAIALASCADRAPTAIVVAVSSDLRVPEELSSVHVEVGGAACTSASCTHDFALDGSAAIAVPFSFAVLPAGSGGPLALVVRGRDGAGADRVVRRVETSFVAERTLLLSVTLERACLDAAACPGSSTCIAGACASAAVDPASLPAVEPGTELDAGDAARADVGTPDAGRDAGRVDAGPVDAGPDGARDAGAPPRACSELPATAVAGAVEIDPDGPGGAAPFLDYCETSADGGGWTLIAKVDPATAALAYSATAWTSVGASGAFGTADLSVGDALLPSYWTVPLRELRIVVADRATPATTRSLVTALVPATTVTLRSAMEASAHVLLDAPQSAWVTLVGARSTPGAGVCEVAGVPALVPEAAPAVRVRIGYVWSDVTGCATPGFWAGAGAEGTG